MDGARGFASANVGTDWRLAADQLLEYAFDPWGRLDAHEAPAAVSPWPEDADPVDCWVEAVTDRAVIAGHQLFVRSAWEGAKAYRESGWDPQVAQGTADATRAVAFERLDADAAFQAAAEEPDPPQV